MGYPLHSIQNYRDSTWVTRIIDQNFKKTMNNWKLIVPCFPDRFSFANDIISGICYLHSHGMVHGRLKIENCLVDDRWTVRLTGLN